MATYHITCSCGKKIPDIPVEAASPEEAAEKLRSQMQTHWNEIHKDDEMPMPDIEDMVEESS